MEINDTVIDLIENSSVNLFLTGRAGTGKTTLLKQIKQTTKKKSVVVSFTSVAALNAGGVTLHSFFQMPFGPLIPHSDSALLQSSMPSRYGHEKIALIRSLDLIIIDEISMVRSDMLDFIDRALKHVRLSELPFGGVQLLCIGDPLQLPPIKENWDILSQYYSSPYFFDSKIYKLSGFINVELQKVYRQNDQRFVSLLNEFRMGKVTTSSLAHLNGRLQSKDQSLDQSYITITTHHRIVNEINESNLNALPGKVYCYKATLKGEFPNDAHPTSQFLELKLGARVIMIKNDDSGQNKYYNGRTAEICRLDESVVCVRFLDDLTELDLQPQVWHNIKYSVSKQSDKIEENIIGSFTQYPIKLAWAITVHKSQGLTFDKVILDVENSFEPGQIYVALSRCRSLNSLFLRNPITQKNIDSDQTALRFMSDMASTENNTQLKNALINNEYDTIIAFFNFEALEKRMTAIKVLAGRLSNDVYSEEVFKDIDDKIVHPARKFSDREIKRFSRDVEISQHGELITRIQQASIYFEIQLDELIERLNVVLAKYIEPTKDSNLIHELFTEIAHISRIKAAIFKQLKNSPAEIKNAVQISKATLMNMPLQSTAKKEITTKNPELYQSLIKWRLEYCIAKGLPPHIVMSDKALQKIAEKTPRTVEQLGAIAGIGASKAREVGENLLSLIDAHFGTQQMF